MRVNYQHDTCQERLLLMQITVFANSHHLKKFNHDSILINYYDQTQERKSCVIRIAKTSED